MVDLKFHRRRCTTCKYYRGNREYNKIRNEYVTSTSCAHPEGRTLTVGFDDPYADHARYCSEWTPMKVSTSPTKLLEQKEVEIVSLRKKRDRMERELAKYKAFWDDASSNITSPPVYFISNLGVRAVTVTSRMGLTLYFPLHWK